MGGQEEDDEVDVAEAGSLTRLDSCTVQVDPPMTEAMEHLRMPENLMKQLHIVADTTPTGLVLTGEKHLDLRLYGFVNITVNTILITKVHFWTTHLTQSSSIKIGR